MGLRDFEAEAARVEPKLLDAANDALGRMHASQRVEWALEHLPGHHALSSSFGAQAAVSLHLVTRAAPQIPVILVDTGYLFAETYRFVDEIVMRLGLNLKVYQPRVSPAWLEARHGKLWEQGVDGIERYNDLRKGEPMLRALDELGVASWFAGLRRYQSRTRSSVRPLEYRSGRWKVHPIVDWTDRQVFQYLTRHDLPYHPLWHQGYVSIGDWHTTRTLAEAGDAEATRFFGLKRECGIHGLEG
ncbi:MAG TPA: phosphoadenylyl-sulfate reductase [Steroidobacteraceae bacterium]|nr:phosphoadenylyl-sulfate reductase [Steroidobacteraceae bacterium]